MAGYLGAIPVPQATQHRESFTATSGQTTFNTAGYTVGFLDVYLNGSHLSPADFTATNGSDVVLASGASADDVCDIISYTAFEVADQTFTGTTTLDGAVVINESSADVDFRVESNGNANMLFVDGGNDAVGIGTSSPLAKLDVASSLSVTQARVRNQSTGAAAILFQNSDTGTGDGDGLYLGRSAGINYLWSYESEPLVFATANTERMRIDSTGAVTKPLQPAFLVKPSGAQNNLPINATTTVLFGTEVFDQNADFASNTFTAPVAGKYQFSFGLYLNNADTATDYFQALLVTSNRQFNEITDSSKAFTADPAYHWMGFSVLTDMDAADTAIVKVDIPNSGAAQMDLEGTASFFSGYLVA